MHIKLNWPGFKFFITSFIIEWPEVWALLIPLAVLYVKRKQPDVNKPVIRYVWAALLINLSINLIWKFKLLVHNKNPYNGFLYNIHSIVRFLLFDAYFNSLYRFRTRKIILYVFALFVIINFSFFEPFVDYESPFSSRLLSVETALLLVLCLQYYFHQLNKEEESSERQPDFWIVTGLGMYVAINFFVFLLYKEITHQSAEFGKTLWTIHNVSYVVLNMFFAKAFYESGKQ